MRKDRITADLLIGDKIRPLAVFCFTITSDSVLVNVLESGSCFLLPVINRKCLMDVRSRIENQTIGLLIK